jgi:hypothetical protein
MDREEIMSLVRRERFARDQQQFDDMDRCFVAGGRVRTSWYDGATEDYAAASRERVGRTGLSKHWVFPARVELVGDRATVESPAMIFNRLVLDGVEVDLDVYCRFFSRALRRNGNWYLRSFEVIWERDMMRCVNPAVPLPLDWPALSAFRPSYKFISYMQERKGTRVSPDLLGDDHRPELNAFYRAERAWLEGSDF